MKTILLIISLVSLSFNSFSQQKTQKKAQTKKKTEVKTTSASLDTVAVSKAIQTSPTSFIDLYSQRDPTPGNLNEMWYAKNRNTSKVIKVTVQFWKGQIEFGNIVTEVYSVSPGEIKLLRAKYSGGTDTWNAQVLGATY